MSLSPEQVTLEIAQDTRPNGLDGCSSAERLAYIMQVFGCDTLDLNERYDYGDVMLCTDPEKVEAAKQLALVQYDYLTRMHYNGHCTVEDLNIQSSMLILSLQKINWHLAHLSAGKATPPFPSIH